MQPPSPAVPTCALATTAQFSYQSLLPPARRSGLAPDFAKAGDLSLRLAIRDPIVMEGFAAAGLPDPGPAGIQTDGVGTAIHLA